MFRRVLDATLEPMAWCVLALIAIFIQLPAQRLPRLYEDSFQYLSAAHELRSNHCMATSLVHFDTERSYGTIPAPMTWFPPGYPLAIALVSAIGVSYERAALLISTACFALTAGGLWCLMRMLDPSRWAARVAVVCWLVNSLAIGSSVSALSEAIFTIFGLASLLFLASTGETSAGARNGISWVGAAVMAGISYWLRYAGILWALTCLTILLARMATGCAKKPSRRTAAVAGASLVLFLAPLMIRNAILTGDWRGGNNTPITMPISQLAAAAPRVLWHLILGDGTLAQLRFPLSLMALGLVGIAVAALRARSARPTPPIWQLVSWRLLATKKGIVAAALLIYSIGIAAIALRSPISYSPRMYIPVLPHIIALATCGVAAITRRLAGGYSRQLSASIVLLLVGYVAGHSVSRASSVGPDIFEKTQKALLVPDGGGPSIKQRLDAGLKPGQIIAATNGQPAGYIMNRPTLSIVGHPFSRITWDALALRKEMDRFGATYLLVFRDPALDPVLQQSPFLAALAAGQAPAWLLPAGSNPDVCVYRFAKTIPDSVDEVGPQPGMLPCAVESTHSVARR